MAAKQMFDRHGGYFGSVSITENKNPDARVTQINLMPCLGMQSMDALWHDVLHHLHEINSEIDAAWKKKEKKKSV